MGDKKSKKKKGRNKTKQSFYNDQLGENVYDEFEKNYENK
jgi:hypothetical protein